MRTLSTLTAVFVLAGIAICTTANAGSFRVDYAFRKKADGNRPTCDLTHVGGFLYASTGDGGIDGVGRLFAINASTGSERWAFDFDDTDGAFPCGLQNIDGTLYGTTGKGGSGVTSPAGTLFTVNPKTAALTVLKTFSGSDGFSGGEFIAVGGVLYGTTAGGGPTNPNCQSGGCGTVFSVNLKTGATATVYMFSGGTGDGSYPEPLLDVGGTLYGVTNQGGKFGGTYGYGTVFSLNPSTGVETVLHFFQGSPSDGRYPAGHLIDVDGVLYGTTATGGASDDGSVFSLNPKTGVEKILYSFGTNTGDGVVPETGLTNINGLLYGTTSRGGSDTCFYGCGTVFSVNRSTGAETLVHVFDLSDGEGPASTLVYVGGTLYGTTDYGGPTATSVGSGNGTVFGYTP